jgi:hypothetical protein
MSPNLNGKRHLPDDTEQRINDRDYDLCQLVVEPLDQHFLKEVETRPCKGTPNAFLTS